MSDTIKIAERLRDWMSIGPVQRAAVDDALAQAREEGRQAGLEGAAKVCETLGVHPALNVYNGGPDWYKHGKDCAKAIRALKEKRDDQ